MPREIKKIPQSTLGRASRLFVSGARIMSSEVIGRFRSQEEKLTGRVKQAQELVATLGKLKGAAMKAGQMLSLEFGDILPPEVSSVLRQLHDDTQFMPLAQVRHILAQEIGHERRNELKNLSPQPIAAASIGQVHRAELNGREVAIKIQYPGIAKCIDSDLSALRGLCDIALQIQGNKVDLDPIFAELKKCLNQEADYRQEAKFLESFRNALDPDYFIVPTLFKDHSSERVLTMSFEEGVKVADWLSTNPDEKIRNALGTKVVALMIKEILDLGMVQSDPNFGNFLFRPNDQKVVLLDFGATITLPDHVRRGIQKVLQHASSGDFSRILDLIQELGLLDPRESDEAKQLMGELIGIHAESLIERHQPYHFRDPEMQSRLRQLRLKFVQVVKYTPPPKDYLFLGRKLGGMLNLLRDIDAKVNVVHELKRYPKAWIAS